jgi:hypothetical protein
MRRTVMVTLPLLNNVRQIETARGGAAALTVGVTYTVDYRPTDD